MLHSASEDLRSAEIAGIAAGWRLSMAYTAALRYARAALYASGFRPGREREHERTIDSLGYTLISLDPQTIKLLHKIRKMRHTATYDSVDMISDTEADAAMNAAVDFGKKVFEWLKANHAEFLK
ncbi:MAG: HEPN domain-containing protein [candidate division Zixibacteria bacterium]|nr:HEPN domain-containing protein [candidate division Zixibacteria bacterium]